jgi:hypothetical protein
VPSASRPSNGKSQTFFTTCIGGACIPLARTQSGEGHEASHEPLNILDILDLTYFSGGQNLAGVRFDTALNDDVPQDLTLGDSEAALLEVQLNVEPPEVVEGSFQVSNEATALLKLHDNVIDIDLQVVPYLPPEVELHIPLIYGPYDL